MSRHLITNSHSNDNGASREVAASIERELPGSEIVSSA